AGADLAHAARGCGTRARSALADRRGAGACRASASTMGRIVVAKAGRGARVSAGAAALKIGLAHAAILVRARATSAAGIDDDRHARAAIEIGARPAACARVEDVRHAAAI